MSHSRRSLSGGFPGGRAGKARDKPVIFPPRFRLQPPNGGFLSATERWFRPSAVAQVDTRNSVARIECRYVRTFHGLTPRIRYQNLPVKRSRPARISARDRPSRGAGEVARKRSQEPESRSQEGLGVLATPTAY